MKIRDFFIELRKEVKNVDGAERIIMRYDHGALTLVDALRALSDLVTADYYGEDKTKF